MRTTNFGALIITFSCVANAVFACPNHAGDSSKMNSEIHEIIEIEDLAVDDNLQRTSLGIFIDACRPKNMYLDHTWTEERIKSYYESQLGQCKNTLTGSLYCHREKAGNGLLYSIGIEFQPSEVGLAVLSYQAITRFKL
jgi:hypothetical protein